MTNRKYKLKDLEETLTREEMGGVQGGQSDSIIFLDSAAVEIVPEAGATVGVGDSLQVMGNAVLAAAPVQTVPSISLSNLAAAEPAPIQAGTLKFNLSNLKVFGK